MKRYEPSLIQCENFFGFEATMSEVKNADYVLYSDAEKEKEKHEGEIWLERSIQDDLLSKLSDEELKNIKLEKRVKELEAEREEILLNVDQYLLNAIGMNDLQRQQARDCIVNED